MGRGALNKIYRWGGEKEGSYKREKRRGWGTVRKNKEGWRGGGVGENFFEEGRRGGGVQENIFEEGRRGGRRLEKNFEEGWRG